MLILKGLSVMLALPVTLVFPMLAIAQPELPAARVDRNVVYGMHFGTALLMDVYYPADPNGYGIVHISGSGWRRMPGFDTPMITHSGHVKTEGAALVAAGYTLFTLNHRAAPQFTYPAAVEDVQRAVRFIRHHAKDYGIEPGRIGAVGGSSGGHLVSMLGLLDGKGDPDAKNPIDRQSAKVQCVVARATPTTFLDAPLGAWFLGLEEGYVLTPGTPEYERAKEASPITHVTPDDPPFLLMHGDKDMTVPYHLSELLEKALLEAGVTVKLLRVEGAGHGPGFSGAIDPPDLDQARVGWFDTHLKQE